MKMPCATRHGRSWVEPSITTSKVWVTKPGTRTARLRPAEDYFGKVRSPFRRFKTYDTHPKAFAVHKKAIESLIGYTFRKDQLLKEAIALKINSSTGKRGLHYTQLHLALIGDSNLRQVFYTHNFPYTGRANLTKAFDALGSNNSLAYAASVWGLPDLLREFGWPECTSRVSAKYFGSLVEAIVGAVYIDSNKSYEHTRTAIMNLLSYTEASRTAGTSLDPATIKSRPIPGAPHRAGNAVKRLRDMRRRENEMLGRQNGVEQAMRVPSETEQSMASSLASKIARFFGL